MRALLAVEVEQNLEGDASPHWLMNASLSLTPRMLFMYIANLALFLMFSIRFPIHPDLARWVAVAEQPRNLDCGVATSSHCRVLS